MLSTATDKALIEVWEQSETAASPDTSYQKAKTEGKFLVVGDRKFFIKGVTYGSFPPNSEGHQFPERWDVAADFALMRKAGINAVLTYTVPPLSLLDQAQEHGLRVITVVPWMEYICFLEDSKVRRQMIREVKEGVMSCRRHPAVLMYCVGKEIPPPIVSWHGRKKVEAFLKDLCSVAKDSDPETLVTYTNFPTTEYLELPFVDVFTFNVYLHDRAQFCAYLSRLQHLAGELPLFLTEFGMCSFRHGREEQAAFLDWQIEEIFDHGSAGAVIFGWTDPFYQDSCLIEEWGFGLVDAERRPKPSYYAVKQKFTDCVPFPPDRKWPKISVVVCAYNAAQTLEGCLNSLEKLQYPDYEVIVVNDGSTDATPSIAQRYPFRYISTANQGISAARNEGLKVARGEIVAYIDSDADADPHWLHYLAATYAKFEVDGVGGPNVVPPDDNWVAKCVYRSPGGPTQVMFNDQYAEHIPGCNMSFRKEALEQIGGFDPIFRKAADDVDICWRLLEKGHQIGFSPSAVVWHHRRPSVRAYWRQQVGYGFSESLLEKKTPNKFNPWGHALWAGRIYAPYPFFRLMSPPTIYHGLWGSAGFQPMYDPGSGNFLSFLPRAMEWHITLIALAIFAVLFPWALAVVGLGLVYTIAYCISCACQANLKVLTATEASPTFARRLKWRAMIAFLHFLEPIARDWGRLKGGLTPWRFAWQPSKRMHASRAWQRLQPFRRQVRWIIPGTMALDKYNFLRRLLDELSSRGCAVGWNPTTTSDWDLKVRRGVLGAMWLRTVVEHHGGPRRLVRFSAVIKPHPVISLSFGLMTTLAVIAGLLGFHAAAVILLLAVASLWIIDIAEEDRLETAVIDTSSAVAENLEAESATRLTMSA
jgi:O-antigen biosynthesis protein